MRGILIASAVGVITPGGPILSFPLVAALFKLGAGYGPLVAYLTSWSVFALHRLFAFEFPMMGSRFAVIRPLSSVILPFIAAISALFLENFFMGN